MKTEETKQNSVLPQPETIEFKINEFQNAQSQTYEPYSDENFVLEQNLPNAPSPEISNAPVESSDIFPDAELETVGDTGDEVRSQPQTEDLPSEYILALKSALVLELRAIRIRHFVTHARNSPVAL
ncbi:hypothetical protein ACJJTC_009210 [Scirpophaga incertulas]